MRLPHEFPHSLIWLWSSCINQWRSQSLRTPATWSNIDFGWNIRYDLAQILVLRKCYVSAFRKYIWTLEASCPRRGVRVWSLLSHVQFVWYPTILLIPCLGSGRVWFRSQASRGCSHNPCTWKGKESCQVLMKRDHQRGVPGVPQLQEVSSESWSKINNWLVVSILRYSKVFGSEMLGFSPLHPLIDHNFPRKKIEELWVSHWLGRKPRLFSGDDYEFSIKPFESVSPVSWIINNPARKGLLQTVQNEVGNDDC